LSLTFDHRIVDGAQAALFLRQLKEMIENPFMLLTSLK
jgi:pyruvate dehydrogenase E2 component (dihydrolipoamide acetyltransferase)